MDIKQHDMQTLDLSEITLIALLLLALVGETTVLSTKKITIILTAKCKQPKRRSDKTLIANILFLACMDV